MDWNLPRGEPFGFVTQASMDLRRVYGQQLQAFTAGALPLGITVVS